MSLPTDAKQRKAVPLCTGVLDYFPDALAAVARNNRHLALLLEHPQGDIAVAAGNDLNVAVSQRIA